MEGASLRILGLVEGGEQESLREAVELLPGSEARLEHARALVGLGAAQAAGQGHLMFRRPTSWPTIVHLLLADQYPLAQLLQGTSERLAAREHRLEQVAVLFDPLERLAHPEAARRHVLC
jgi:hypothetical protein